MIKRIKLWYMRKKIQKQLEIEMIETMCTILKYLEAESRYTRHGRELAYHFESHFEKLKEISCQLRGVEYRPVRKTFLKWRVKNEMRIFNRMWNVHNEKQSC